MEYSHELLALFNHSQFQQPSNSEWLQSGSSIPIVADLESGENYEDALYHHSNKFPVNYSPNDSLANCFTMNRRPISFNGTIQNDVLSHNSSAPGSFSHHQSQFMVSVEDATQQSQQPQQQLQHAPQFALESERKLNLLHPTYHEQELHLVPQATPKSSPLELCQSTNLKRQRRASAQTNSSSSSTRRSSSITNGPVTDHYPNYTTSSPSKHWSSITASPRKKARVFPSLYLSPYEGPKYRCQGPKKYELVRGIASGSTTRPPYSSSRTNVEYVPVELNISGASVDEINKTPWNYEERQDGRRIVRLERRQYGHVVNASFSVVGSAVENPVPEEAPSDVGVVEVSCLNYVSQEEEEEDDDIRFSITSVEVVNIIEALIASTTMSSELLRKEKGRIRSNLMPFWSKKPLSSKKSAMLEKSDSRTDFARRIMRYEVRKPRGFDKDVRILSWDKLASALHRALQCYYVEVPKEDLIDPISEHKGSFFEKTG